MATTWHVVGLGPGGAHITAECPACKTSTKIGPGPRDLIVKAKFRHSGCNGLAEEIPIEIKGRYYGETFRGIGDTYPAAVRQV